MVQDRHGSETSQSHFHKGSRRTAPALESLEDVGELANDHGVVPVRDERAPGCRHVFSRTRFLFGA